MLKIIKNPDGEIYNEVTKAVKANDGYCPCMLLQNDDTKCICKSFKEQETEGECHCGRYIKTDIYNPIVPPGETLKEILDDRNISQNELAICTGISAVIIENIIDGLSGISIEIAEKLEDYLKIDSSFWLNQQARYDKDISNATKNII